MHSEIALPPEPFALEYQDAPATTAAVHVASGDWLAVSYGGGDNSWAGLLGLAERDIKPDFIGMADTKGEKPNTYSHLEEVAMPWVSATWGMEITIVKKLAYGRRSCSQKYKHEMLERALAAAMAAGGVTHARKAIFYHAMEQYRVARAPRSSQAAP